MKNTLCLLIFFVVANYVSAQENNTLENQTITIYTEFSPVIKDANRIQSLPVIIDTVKVNPKFEYNVMPSMYKTYFKPSSITAASVKGELLKPLETGMLKVGFGNYTSPYIEGYINSKRQKDYSVGLYVKHQSSHGKIKNSVDQKIYSGYDDNVVEAFGKRIMRKAVFSGKLKFTSNQSHFYGYDPYVLAIDSILPYDYIDTKAEMESQRFNRMSANIRLESANKSLKYWDYLLNANYQYFFSSNKDKQHKINTIANIARVSKKVAYGADINFIFNNNINPLESYNELVLNANPYFKFKNEKWNIRIGINTCGELGNNNVIYHFYPGVYIQHNISNVIIPYFSFDGHIENNNLEFISKINPFVNRINTFEVTNYAQDINLGIKANISKKVYLHINGNYSKIDNMGLFVNDTTTNLHNKFAIEYTNVERFSGYAELSLRNMIQGLDIILKGHYYHYSYLRNHEKPWQLPTIDATLRAEYKLTANISFGIETYFENSKYAKEFDIEGNIVEKKMKAIVDGNIFGEYSFSKDFIAFLYLNNIAGQKYYIWNNYRAQGFNFLVGIKYSF